MKRMKAKNSIFTNNNKDMKEANINSIIGIS